MGDPAQLPPVGTILSPALNIDLLKSLDMKVYSSELQEVVRQSFDSGILFNASTIRKSINIEQQLDFPKLKMNFPDIINLSSENILDEIQNSYSKYGLEETKIICKSNKAANVYNNGVRNRILWREEQISSGDLLMVVKNNYFWLPEKYEMDFIANGDILEVKRIIKTQDIYGYRFTDILVNLIDFPEQQFKVKVILDVLNVETASMPADYYKILYNKLYEDYVHLGTKKKINEAIFNDPFFNALQIKFAYALTCHKSQGGQWKVVFLDHEWLNMKKFTNEVKYEFFRWLYTAFTRATEKLYLVNFNVVFFE
jgi:exodeoxyribonuclease-5